MFTCICECDILFYREVLALATKAHLEGNKRYLEKQDNILIRVPKGRKAELQAHAERRGESLNGFIVRAVDETIERDNEKEGD